MNCEFVVCVVVCFFFFSLLLFIFVWFFLRPRGAASGFVMIFTEISQRNLRENRHSTTLLALNFTSHEQRLTLAILSNKFKASKLTGSGQNN
jgi:hypothetical protein